MAHRTTLSSIERDFVHKQRVGRLATADENGSPYLIPVCYAFDGQRFYTPLDEKPKSVKGRQLRRVRNIEARHEASLLIDKYEEDWSQLGYVLVYGHAALLEPKDALHQPAVQLLRERYSQYLQMALELYPIIMLTPERITAWGPALHNS
ncbi:TIGR03668 family PPOX class F420-dependent oxidoreductase [Ktedonosporobacter rubrisoli]|uniref:TIGR03668 family PPOX class F420-dependent oxidoreductase n=1 Tax=Ktedonosporobacter rubrisoli TaxID=2509675 RepID=A0A4P6JTJ0_KTERU|nr:TIGR03668 family PPOX class F420-dependent oxidoreductase [Ktedonosporobacter rubrisoli]QBD78888.1 TIGR03668 family PPOX class F420-dependent oxidoreductase [Ktedonosporobacter rubrisoli]